MIATEIYEETLERDALQISELKTQLTKAKELLTFWVNDFYDNFNHSNKYEERHKALVETEQFLKEVTNE